MLLGMFYIYNPLTNKQIQIYSVMVSGVLDRNKYIDNWGQWIVMASWFGSQSDC